MPFHSGQFIRINFPDRFRTEFEVVLPPLPLSAITFQSQFSRPNGRKTNWSVKHGWPIYSGAAWAPLYPSVGWTSPELNHKTNHQYWSQL